MTDDELTAIEQRVANATDGTWERNDFYSTTVQAPAEQVQGEPYPVADTERGHDASFIAHAREDVPALIAEVRRLSLVAQNAMTRLSEREAQIDRDWAGITTERGALKAQLAKACELLRTANGIVNDYSPGHTVWLESAEAFLAEVK